MLSVYLDFYERVFGIRQCALHDPLAAIIAAGTAGIVKEDRPAHVGVLTEGDERGRTIRQADAGTHPARDRRIIREIAGSAGALLLERLRGHRWPT